MTTSTLEPAPTKANPAAHLTDEDVENLGRELDAIRQQLLDSRGERDASYIRSVIDFQRKLELGSRAVLLFSLFPPAWIVGTAGLSISKIVENMEIGHNVMHGQWDWMRDDKIHSTTWEWDNASPLSGRVAAVAVLGPLGWLASAPRRRCGGAPPCHHDP
jgi:linoleoyl-CoA desaturase